MKKYLIIGGLSFALGAGALFYSGVVEDVTLLSQSFAARNEQALAIDAALAGENLQRVKLDTELYTLQHEIEKRKLEQELEALNEIENAQKLALEDERAANKEWAWWVSFAKIFWLLVIAVILPLSALSVLIVKAFVAAMRGADDDQAE